VSKAVIWDINQNESLRTCCEENESSLGPKPLQNWKGDMIAERNIRSSPIRKRLHYKQARQSPKGWKEIWLARNAGGRSYHQDGFGVGGGLP